MNKTLLWIRPRLPRRNHKYKRNTGLTPVKENGKTLNGLKENKTIIVKEMDKGKAVVLMDTEFYKNVSIFRDETYIVRGPKSIVNTK